MRERKLTLRSEALAELSGDDLTEVVGGATPLCLTYQPTLCYLCQLLTREVC